MSSCSESTMVKSAVEPDEVIEHEMKQELEHESCDSKPNNHDHGIGSVDDRLSPKGGPDCEKCNCSCHTTNADCIFEEKLSESVKFRELILLHLDIIEEQNVRLQNKEKEIHHLKNENEQLNARLNRMERRVALKVRKHTDETDADSVKSKTSIQKRSYSFGGAESTNRSRKIAAYGSVGVTVSSKQSKDSGTGCYLKTDVDYLQMTSYLTTKPKIKKDDKIKIPVPSWKDVPAEHNSRGQRNKTQDKANTDGLDEVTDDDSYQRRHSKMEQDEIRRKRWDIQQIRQERMQETLRQRQREREDPKQSKNPTTSADKQSDYLHPPCSNVMAIEVVNEVPVFALGARIPRLERSEFDLPWFDVAKREIQNRQKRMKSSRSQRRKTWYKY